MRLAAGMGGEDEVEEEELEALDAIDAESAVQSTMDDIHLTVEVGHTLGPPVVTTSWVTILGPHVVGEMHTFVGDFFRDLKRP